MKTAMIIDQTYQGLQHYQPTTLAELIKTLPLTKTQIRNGLERLRKKGKAKYQNFQWVAILVEEPKPTNPLGPSTEEEREEVLALCTGKHLRELRDALPHYATYRVQQIVRELRNRRRIYYTVDGWKQGSAEISALPLAYTTDRYCPQISKEDLEWMNYWKPENRLKRQKERWVA